MTAQTLTSFPPANMAQPIRRSALPALTGIRFIAALYVVFFHFGASFAQRHGAPAPAFCFLANGWTAVTLFFMLSGFILSYTYSGQIEGSAHRSRFWQARFARIYPVYLLSLLLMLPFLTELNGREAFSVLAMIQAWNPLHIGDAGAWNMPAWTLSTEAFFYLCFPFLLPLAEKVSTRLLLILGGGLMLLIAFVHTMTPLSDHWVQTLYIPLPVFRIPEFLLGMLSGLIFLRKKEPSFAPLLAVVSLLAIIVLEATISGFWISLVVIPFTVLLYSLAAGDGWLVRILSGKWFVLLGGASYSVYLLQLPIRHWTHLIFARHTAADGIDTVLSPILLIAVSILVFLYWEEPAREWIRKRFRSRIPSGIQSQAAAAIPPPMGGSIRPHTPEIRQTQAE
jgi:peptidoglycan/LPS O-acetylase OafA/YrhL